VFSARCIDINHSAAPFRIVDGTIALVVRDVSAETFLHWHGVGHCTRFAS